MARQDAEIEASTKRAIAAREAQRARPMTALESLAARLDVSPSSLQETLLQTVFKNCSKAEFVALVIVSNTYNLNPLLREIYAFPKKGGGIQAIVGYDGWIKIANSHPQYDGFESVHIEEQNGDLKAIEGVLHRKDRSHPTKKLVYLKEFKRNTEPWNTSPHHMLDVRCFCQTVRLALGIPLGVEGIDDLDAGVARMSTDATVLPSNGQFVEHAGVAEEHHDPETGEVSPRDERTGMTEVDEETARELDAAQGYGDDADYGDEGDASDEDQQPAWAVPVAGIRQLIENATDQRSWTRADTEFQKIVAGLPDDVAAEINNLLAAKRRELKGEG
jgi:phage recombination protein Bet